MRFRLLTGWVGALLLGTPEAVRAQWVLKPFVGAAVGPRHGFVDREQGAGESTLVVGAAAGCQPRTIGVEFEWSVLPRFFDGPGDLLIAGPVTTVLENVTWQLPRPQASSRLRAYLAGSAGVVQVRLRDALDAFSSTTALAAGNVGGGVTVRLRPRLNVHVDVRQFRTQFEDAGRSGFDERFVSFTRFAGGVGLRS
jgi:hypothetical protein